MTTKSLWDRQPSLPTTMLGGTLQIRYRFARRLLARNAHVLLLEDAGALASLIRWRSSGLAIFPTAFFGSISSMYTSRGTL